jgi:hypothetical protein
MPRLETLYDILDFNGNRLYANYANDAQCEMYYDPDSNGIVHYHTIEKNEWTVIESNNYVENWK